MRRWRRSTAGVSAAAAASTVREERPRYLLKCRGRGRVVTQRKFGPTRSLAARSAATLTVAASRAAHEHLSPTGGRAKRVARMGRSGGCEVGKGGAEKPRRGCEVAGRAQAGGANTTCVQGHCARARVGGARTFRLDLALLARRQDVVDPEGHEVRGRGECPDPAAGYPAGGWAELAGASSPAPASSCTAIVSLSRGQAIYGYLTRRLTAPARRRTPPRCSSASRKLFGRTSIAIRAPAARSLARHEFPPPTCIREKGVRLERAVAVHCRLFSEKAGKGGFEHTNDCDSPGWAAFGHAMLACPEGGTARSRTIRLSN